MGWLLGGIAMAQTLPWEFVESRSTPNYQSQRGVPISRVAGTPPGSDGRVPNSNESTGIPVAPTGGSSGACPCWVGPRACGRRHGTK